MTTNIHKVTVPGTGVLGSQIAYQTAYCGYPVAASDVGDDALASGRQRIHKLAERYEREVKLAANGRARTPSGGSATRPTSAEAVHEGKFGRDSGEGFYTYRVEADDAALAA